MGGYDITGAIIASVDGSFKYYGQRSRLSMQFIPSTIMNQADVGNEIVIYAPDNYRFPRNCTDFSFRFSNMDQIDQRYPNADQYIFPPAAYVYGERQLEGSPSHCAAAGRCWIA